MLKINEASVERSALIKLFGYQPFELPDGTVTGAGLGMLKGSSIRALKPNESDQWQIFQTACLGQAKMYEDILIAVDTLGGGFLGRTYADIACNAGYFCHRALELGATSATGVDAGDFALAFDVVNLDKGHSAKYLNASYNMRTHRFDELPTNFKSDIVSNMAFMCHDSDPTYLLEALANMAKETLILHTKIIPTSDYLVRYSHVTKRHFGGEFPVCFDGATEISEGLLFFGLKELGFTTVNEVPHQSYWVPGSPEWRCFIATR